MNERPRYRLLADPDTKDPYRRPGRKLWLEVTVDGQVSGPPRAYDVSDQATQPYPWNQDSPSYPDSLSLLATRMGGPRARLSSFPEHFIIRMAKKPEKEKQWKSDLKNEILALRRLEAAGLGDLAPQIMASADELDTTEHVDDDPRYWGLRVERDDGTRATGLALRNFTEGHQTISQWSKAHGKIPIKVWLWYVHEVTQALRLIHRQRVTHGYLSPDNVFIRVDRRGRPRWPRFVNFAKALALGEPPVRFSDEANMWRRPFDPPEMLFRRSRRLMIAVPNPPNAPWFTATDIFSLGLHLLCLITGDKALLGPWIDERAGGDPDSEGPYWRMVASQRLKSNVLIKREIFERVKEMYKEKEKLGQCVAVTEILYSYLRIEVPRRLTDLDQIIDTMYQFGPLIDPKFPPTEGEDGNAGDTERTNPRVALERFWHPLLKEAGLSHPPLQKLVNARVRRFLLDFPEPRPEGRGSARTAAGSRDAAGARRGVAPETCLTIRGGRLQMIDSLLAMILSLEAGWEIDAVTGVTFWFQENIAAGRVLSALMIARMKDCRVRWNLVLRERDITNIVVTKAMDGLKYVDLEMIEEFRGSAASAKREWEWKWVSLPDVPYDQFVQGRESFIRMHRRAKAEPGEDAGNTFYVAPDYQLDSGTLALMRVWPASEEFRKLYAKYYLEPMATWFKVLQSYPQFPVDLGRRGKG